MTKIYQTFSGIQGTITEGDGILYVREEVRRDINLTCFDKNTKFWSQISTVEIDILNDKEANICWAQWLLYIKDII